MTSAGRQITVGSVLLAGTFIVAVIGYLIAGWSLIDSVYMVVITVFGVGYGEVEPMTNPKLKLFTIGVIVVGCTALVYMVGGFVQLVAEGQINHALGRRRMTKEIAALTKHVIICGYGRIGYTLAQRLTEAHVPFVVVDGSESRMQEAAGDHHIAYEGDATEEATLKAVGIERADTLVTCLPNDAANVFIALSARQLNPDIRIIARGERASTEPKLRQAGAAQVVLPPIIGAERIAHMIVNRTTDEALLADEAIKKAAPGLTALGLGFTELSVIPGSPIIGKELNSVELVGHGAFVIVAVMRGDGTFIEQPPGDTVLEAHDRVVAIGHQSDTARFAESNATPQTTRYRGQKVKR